MDPRLGGVLLLLSNLSAFAILVFLRTATAEPLRNTAILALANLLLGSISIVYLAVKPTQAVKAKKYLLSWSCCYCTIYFLFLRYPQEISLSQMIVVQSLSPLISVILSFDFKRTYLNWKGAILRISPIIFLLTIAFDNPSNVRNDYHFTSIGVFIILFIAFAISQSSARAFNRANDGSLHRTINGMFQLNLLNGVILTAIVSCLGFSVDSLSGYNALSVGLSSASILFILVTYSLGIKWTEPFLSAILMSSSVPIALILETIFFQMRPSIIAWTCSILYLIVGSVQIFYTTKSKVRIDTKIPTYESAKGNKY